MKNVDELVKEVVKLISVPDVYYKLESLIEQPTSTIDDFAFVLGSDAALCARLLCLANSAFYSMSATPIVSIEKAVMQIGIRQIREMILVTTVKTGFDAMPSSQINMDSFWRHSVAVGMMAKNLAKAIRMPQPEKMYVPGLLHDLGRLILFARMPDDMDKLMIRQDEESLLLHHLESDYLKFNHAELGGRLLEEWKVPHSIVEPVSYHHQPSQSHEFYQETSLVFIADRIVMYQRFGSSGEAYLGSFSKTEESIVKELGLDIDSLDDIWKNAKEDVNEVVKQFLKH